MEKAKSENSRVIVLLFVVSRVIILVEFIVLLLSKYDSHCFHLYVLINEVIVICYLTLNNDLCVCEKEE